MRHRNAIKRQYITTAQTTQHCVLPDDSAEMTGETGV